MGSVRSSVALALGLALALLLQGCGRDAATSATSPRSAATASGTATASSPEDGHGSHEGGSEVDAYLALCDAVAEVEGGDPERAEATFHDRVHEALHELADRLEATDRAASAALLVAKAKVEEDLDHDPIDAGALAADIRTLLDAMGDALRAEGSTPPACPAEASA